MALLIGKSVGEASIHVDDYDRARDGTLQCRGCEASLVAKKGEQRAHHFAHASGRSCDPWRRSSKMGEWHKWWQGFAKLEWQEVVVKKRNPAWLYNDDELFRHIADVMNPETRGVVEVQHSHLSIEEAVERESFYDKMIWVVDGTSPGVVRVAGGNFAVIAAQRSFWGAAMRPVYVDTMAGLYLVKEWHDEHKKLCLGMSVDMEGFFGSLWGSGVDTSAFVSRYRSRRCAAPDEMQMLEIGLEVRGSTYKWRGELRESGFEWSTKRRCWYFSADEGRRERVKREWERIDRRNYVGGTKAGVEAKRKARTAVVGQPEWL